MLTDLVYEPVMLLYVCILETNLFHSQSSRILDCSEHTISFATLSRRSCDLEEEVHHDRWIQLLI